MEKEKQEVNLSSSRFFNRELSWLAFNERVLEEASNTKYPLLERLRFISISSSNMDEFYMVRVAGLKGMVAENISSTSPDGLSPSQQLDAIIPAVNRLASIQQECFKEIREEQKDQTVCRRATFCTVKRPFGLNRSRKG